MTHQRLVIGLFLTFVCAVVLSRTSEIADDEPAPPRDDFHQRIIYRE